MFFTADGKTLQFEEMLKLLEDFIVAEKIMNRELKLIIGCDSQTTGKDSFLFAVAVAIHSVGHGGRFFIHRKRLNGFFHMSDRLFQEATLSLEIAERMKGNSFIDMVDSIEIHADVGHNGKSSQYANAIKAMIEGYGYEGRIKPEAAVATHIADHYVR